MKKREYILPIDCHKSRTYYYKSIIQKDAVIADFLDNREVCVSTLLH